MTNIVLKSSSFMNRDLPTFSPSVTSDRVWLTSEFLKYICDLYNSCIQDGCRQFFLNLVFRCAPNLKSKGLAAGDTSHLQYQLLCTPLRLSTSDSFCPMMYTVVDTNMKSSPVQLGRHKVIELQSEPRTSLLYADRTPEEITALIEKINAASRNNPNGPKRTKAERFKMSFFRRLVFRVKRFFRLRKKRGIYFEDL